MPAQTAFTPYSTATLGVTSASIAGDIPKSARVLELQNEGTVTVFVAWAESAAVATTSDYPVLPGQAKTITVGPGAGSVAAITASGTATLYVSAGEGL